MRLDEIVEKYIQLRDKKAIADADHKAATAKMSVMLDRMEAMLLQQFDETGLESVKTKAGTAYKHIRTSATVADWDTFFGTFILENKAWEFLERRCNKTAVEQYRNTNEDLPPGINYTETREVGVRRS